VSVYGPYPGTVAGVHDGDTVNVNLEIDEDVGFDLHLIARIYTRRHQRARAHDGGGEAVARLRADAPPAGLRRQGVVA
jgi:hypothetical protein